MMQWLTHGMVLGYRWMVGFDNFSESGEVEHASFSKKASATDLIRIRRISVWKPQYS